MRVRAKVRVRLRVRVRVRLSFDIVTKITNDYTASFRDRS